MLEKFLALEKHCEGSMVFRRILHTKHGFKLREEPMPSYGRARELIKLELQNEGLNPELHGIHSPRPLGTTEAMALGAQTGWCGERKAGAVRGPETIILKTPKIHYFVLLNYS